MTDPVGQMLSNLKNNQKKVFNANLWKIEESCLEFLSLVVQLLNQYTNRQSYNNLGSECK